MTRSLLVPFLMLVLAACPGGGEERSAAAPPATPPPDTTPMNLDSLQAAIPPAVPDTPAPRRARARPRFPAAPAALVEAVEREQGFSRFCYQEFGQKADPTLEGGVSMVVAVGASGITDAHVEEDTWSSGAGRAVNDCLNERAARAWKPAPGSVKPGTYLVQLRFRPT